MICNGCLEIIYVPPELAGEAADEDGYIPGIYYCDACEPDNVELP